MASTRSVVPFLVMAAVFPTKVKYKNSLGVILPCETLYLIEMGPCDRIYNIRDKKVLHYVTGKTDYILLTGRK